MVKVTYPHWVLRRRQPRGLITYRSAKWECGFTAISTRATRYFERPEPEAGFAPVLRVLATVEPMPVGQVQPNEFYPTPPWTLRAALHHAD